MGKLIDAVQQKDKREEGREDLESLREQILKGDTKRLNCDVPAHIYKQLQIKAIQEDSNITGVINRLVREYVNS